MLKRIQKNWGYRPQKLGWAISIRDGNSTCSNSTVIGHIKIVLCSVLPLCQIWNRLAEASSS